MPKHEGSIRQKIWKLIDENPNITTRQMIDKMPGVHRGTICSARNAYYHRKSSKPTVHSAEVTLPVPPTTIIKEVIPDDIGNRVLDAFLNKIAELEFEVKTEKSKRVLAEKEKDEIIAEKNRVLKAHNQAQINQNKKERISFLLNKL